MWDETWLQQVFTGDEVRQWNTPTQRPRTETTRVGLCHVHTWQTIVKNVSAPSWLDAQTIVKNVSAPSWLDAGRRACSTTLLS